MLALVTGGTGFVGSHMVRTLLEAGHRVRVLHRANSKLSALEGLTFESAIGDILDADSLRLACEDVAWVFHVAAVADYWRADQTHMFKVNVDGTRNVLDAARGAGVRRVIHTSSAAAVGLRPDGKPADEHVAFNLPPQRFPYGYSKLLSERVVAEAVAKGQDIVTVNPVVVIGPGDLKMISGTFITQVRQSGLLTPVTSGSVALVDVRDVTRWQLVAAEQGRRGERYILGSVNISYRTWYAMIADVVGVPRPLIHMPDFVLPAAAHVVEIGSRFGLRFPVDANQIRLSSRHVIFDYARTWAELGNPHIDIATSLYDTYSWYRAHGYMK